MQTERYHTRDRSYGIWHRVKSIARFLGPRQAGSLTMADLDSVLFAEYNYPDKLPLCLIEVARDIGQEKPTGVIHNLAKLSNLPAYVVLYSHSEYPNPSNTNWPDIEQFRIKRVWPKPEESWRTLRPEEWARALVQIRGWQLRRFQVQEAANDPEYSKG
jgi:hypothetical protein